MRRGKCVGCGYKYQVLGRNPDHPYLCGACTTRRESEARRNAKT